MPKIDYGNGPIYESTGCDSRQYPGEQHFAGHAKRLQRCFERGKEVIRHEKPDHDYAHTMFAECVLHDPANLEYVETMLDNLQRKYHNNKRGARLKGFGGRGSFKKVVAAQDWTEVFRQGLDLLKTNPWDVTTLRA